VTVQAINHGDIRALQNEVAQLRGDVRELIDAWNTARGVVKFVKYLSATVTTVSAAIGAVWAVLHLSASK